MYRSKKIYYKLTKTIISTFSLRVKTWNYRNTQKAIFNLRKIKEWQELKSFPLLMNKECWYMFLSDRGNIKLPLSVSTPETNNICFDKIAIDFFSYFTWKCQNTTFIPRNRKIKYRMYCEWGINYFCRILFKVGVSRFKTIIAEELIYKIRIDPICFLVSLLFPYFVISVIATKTILPIVYKVIYDADLWYLLLHVYYHFLIK